MPGKAAWLESSVNVFSPGRLQKLAAVAACPVLPETVAEGRTLGDWVLLPLLCLTGKLQRLPAVPE